MQLPITIGLHRSYLALMGIALSHGAAVVTVLLTPWHPWVKGGLMAGVAASALLSRGLWKPKLAALCLLGDGRLVCRLAGGEEYLSAELLPGATVHPWLTVIRLKAAGDVLAAVVLPDSTTPEESRRLRVWLRWRAEFRASAGAG